METIKLSFDTMRLSSRHFVEELLYLGIRDRALLNLQSACRHRYKLLEFEWKTHFRSLRMIRTKISLARRYQVNCI